MSPSTGGSSTPSFQSLIEKISKSEVARERKKAVQKKAYNSETKNISFYGLFWN